MNFTPWHAGELPDTLPDGWEEWMKRIEVEAWPCGRRSGKKGKSVEQQAMDVVTEERERAKACRVGLAKQSLSKLATYVSRYTVT